MPANPFVPPFDRLPVSLPIFPLPGAIVMPRAPLPLNIFEPRYLNMVTDALAEDRMIGMVQPDPRAADPRGETVCRTGTAGRITAYNETRDGRFLIRLTGVCRFDIREEVPTVRGYRRVIADWSRFAVDYEDGGRVPERRDLLDRLKRYADARQLEIEWDTMRALDDLDLVNVLVTMLPLDIGDKQALVEAVTLADRARLLSGLLEIAQVPTVPPPPRPH
ncbi:MAG: LON peptidase substrate-binding domain-containing protein [Gammaproteobacteria bacterium]|jgi:Lon protease-like protein|nr:LON peptidase substrate-binding domain-containing protein [Gammaproteobacteria bacterium]